jgi:hypothetical protein
MATTTVEPTLAKRREALEREQQGILQKRTELATKLDRAKQEIAEFRGQYDRDCIAAANDESKADPVKWLNKAQHAEAVVKGLSIQIGQLSDQSSALDRQLAEIIKEESRIAWNARDLEMKADCDAAVVAEKEAGQKHIEAQHRVSETHRIRGYHQRSRPAD